MKKVTFAMILLLIFFASGCTIKQEVQELSDRRPMIMVGDHLFLDTDKEISIEFKESEGTGEVYTSVPQHEKPTEDGQTNFGSMGSKYAPYGENIVVRIKDKWILFERAD